MKSNVTLDDFLNSEKKNDTKSLVMKTFEDFPPSWKLVEIKTVINEIQSGFACSKKYVKGNGILHLRPNNIGFNGELDLSQLVFFYLLN